MKIGFNLLLWTGHVTEENFAVIEKLKAAGAVLGGCDAAMRRRLAASLGAARIAEVADFSPILATSDGSACE